MGYNGMYSTSVSTNHDVRTELDMYHNGNIEFDEGCERYIGAPIRPVYVG